MATYTQTIVAGANTFTVTNTISNADMARAVTALRATYATSANPLATDALAAAFFFAQVVKGLVNLTHKSEQDAAVATTISTVTDITVT